MGVAEELTPEGADENTVETVKKIEKLPVPLTAHGEVMAIMPRNIEEAGRYAQGLCVANIVPDAFREGGKRDGTPNHALVMMGVLKSMEVGVPPQTGLAGLLPINGRFSVWGDLATALVLRTGKVTNQSVTEIGAEGFDESAAIGLWPDAYGFRVCYWRDDQETPFVGQFTVRDAKRAGLWNNANRKPWVLYPKRMLFNRARAFALRDGFADGLSGLTIAEEVLDSLPPPVDERGGSKRLAALTDEKEATDETEA
jgi:hypothetical protein